MAWPSDPLQKHNDKGNLTSACTTVRMRHICEQLKVNDTMDKDNVINFSERSKEAQENFLQTPIPTASDIAYYTSSLIRKDYTPIVVKSYDDLVTTIESEVSN